MTSRSFLVSFVKEGNGLKLAVYVSMCHGVASPGGAGMEWMSPRECCTLLVCDGASALCLPCQTVLEGGKCSRFLDCPSSTLCYPKTHLRTRNSLPSQLGNNYLSCHSSAAHWTSWRSCLSMEAGSSCSLSLILSFAHCRLLMTSVL